MTLFLFTIGISCLLVVLWACLLVAADRDPVGRELDDMEQIAAVSRPADLEGTK